MKKIIILAGHFLEFQHYARENQTIYDKLVYVSGIQAMMGIQAEEVRIIGTFWERKDAGKLKRFADTRVY